MSLPNATEHREVIKGYLQEAKKYLAEKDLAEQRLKSVYDSVKDTEDKFNFSLAEFKEALAALQDYDKVQSIVDKKSAALEIVDTLGL